MHLGNGALRTTEGCGDTGSADGIANTATARPCGQIGGFLHSLCAETLNNRRRLELLGQIERHGDHLVVMCRASGATVYHVMPGGRAGATLVVFGARSRRRRTPTGRPSRPSEFPAGCNIL